MTEPASDRGKALFIPTLHLHGGQVRRHGRWAHGAAFFTGTPVEVARRFFADGNNRLHVFLDDGPTIENRRALDDLCAAGAVVIVEGELREVSSCLALAADGRQLQVVEPALLDDPAALSALAAKVPAPVLAVGSFAADEILSRVQKALAGSFVGIVLDLGYPVDVEGLGHLKAALERREAELFLRATPLANAGLMQKQLHPLGPLDLVTFVDGEFLVEMLRFNRISKQIDWGRTLSRLEETDDKFLAETARFIYSESQRGRSEPPANDNPWDLDEGTRADLRLLLATLKEYSGYQLLDCPVFKPFGVSLDNAGRPQVATAQLEGEPELDEYRQAIVNGFRRLAAGDEVRAAGYAEHGRTEAGSILGEVDVVRVHMEHRSGVAMLVTLSYQVAGRETVTFGDGFARRDEPHIFGAARE